MNGRTGELLWKFEDTKAKNRLMNLYTAHIIDDLDGDTVVDILVIHGGDPLSEPGILYVMKNVSFVCLSFNVPAAFKNFPCIQRSH